MALINEAPSISCGSFHAGFVHLDRSTTYDYQQAGKETSEFDSAICLSPFCFLRCSFYPRGDRILRLESLSRPSRTPKPSKYSIVSN